MSSSLVTLLLLVPLISLTGATGDFRTVSNSELLRDVDRFAEEGVTDFGELLFDFPRYQVLAGARDALFRLSLEGLTKLEKAEWEAQETTRGLCSAKGRSEADCRNFVKVLVKHRDKVFACGTHAFSPKCSWRPIEEINKVEKWIDGRGKCPYSPHDNSSAVMTRTGDYYIGSATDFSSNDHAIYRMSGDRFRDMLRTIQYNSLWLSKPDFVASFETDRFVYFLFRETAVEHTNCGKAVYSRMARVCKNDEGGKIVLKDNWTTFLKARLNCSVPGDYPFYFDHIQSAAYLAEEAVVYATFTTGASDIAGSAVCSFNMSAVEHAFGGPFKTRAGSDSIWGPESADHSQFECNRPDGDAERNGVNSRQYQLVNDAVQPTSLRPLYTVREGNECVRKLGRVPFESFAERGRI